MGCNLFGLGFDLIQGLHDRRTTHGDRTRAVRTHSKGHASGITVHDIDRIHRDAQARRHHLRKSRFVTLAMAMRTGKDGHAAGWMHADFTAFKQASARAQGTRDVAWRKTASFDVA